MCLSDVTIDFDLCGLPLLLHAPFLVADFVLLFDSVVVLPGLVGRHLAVSSLRVRYDLMLAPRGHYLWHSWVLECILKWILDPFLIRGALIAWMEMRVQCSDQK